MRLFALHNSQVFGEKLANLLNRSLDPHEERNFEDGEHKVRPLVSVRDEDVYVMHSLHADETQSVNDKLCKLLFFIATLKDCGAQRITVAHVISGSAAIEWKSRGSRLACENETSSPGADASYRNNNRHPA